MSNSKVAQLKPEFANMFVGDEFPNRYDEASKDWKDRFHKEFVERHSIQPLIPSPNTTPLPTVIKDTRGVDPDPEFLKKYQDALNKAQKIFVEKKMSEVEETEVVQTTDKGGDLNRALRHNRGKLRFDLIPTYPIEQVAKVFTEGAKKYAPNNWKKGMPWSEAEASLRRHLEAYAAGEDFDPETGLYHMAHVIANAMFITDYYRSNPQFDDRIKPYLKMPKIVLDIDEVVCSWTEGYLKKYGEESKGLYWDASYKIGDRLKELEKDEEFWVNLPMLHRPDFVPHAYISSRSIPIEWSMKFLEKNDLPCRPVHHVPWGASKIEKLKEVGADIFIDDRFDNFKEAEEAGITSFLMDSHHNRHYNVGYRRIHDLSLRNIVR